MNLIATLRKPKVGPFAVFDLTTAFGGMYLLAPKLGISHERALWATLPLAVATHALLGIKTPLNERVAGPGNLGWKALVGVMAYKALK